MSYKGKGKLRAISIIGAAVIMALSTGALAESVGGKGRVGSISLTREPAGRQPLSGGSLFSMEFRDADLKDVLRALGQENKINIIIGEDVGGKLTLSFQRVSLNEAFNAILKINNLMSLEEGGIIRVFKSPFPEGEGNMITRMIPVNFANARESQDTVKGLLSKQGAITMDPRTNTLIIRDVPENVDRIAAILKNLDTRTPQVLIEARIVEASTNFARELGVQWGGNLREVGSGGTYQITGATSRADAAATPKPLTGGAGLSGNNFVVNLPATVGPGAGGALGLTFGNIRNTFDLDLQLSAMEDTGKGRILSNPRILALDNREAKISSGTEILIPVTTITTGIGTGAQPPAGGATGTTTSGVTTINAKLELTVTPHVTPDNNIVMHVIADKKEPDFNRAVQEIPPLTTRTAETDLLVKNGETIVIGGIYTRNESVSQQGIPWLSRIPILGWLFKKETRKDDQSELLIFITPTIQQAS
jgi:type IV pilus assembly protein PilQ